MILLYLSLLLSPFDSGQSRTPAPSQTQTGRAHLNGPQLHDLERRSPLSAHEILHKMFVTMESKWLVAGYQQAGSVEIRGNLDVELPAGQNQRSAARFSVEVDGIYNPNGTYIYKVQGDLGDLELVRNRKRQLTISHDFKSFSDTPQRARSSQANFLNFQTYLLSKMVPFKHRILESGYYRYAYGGSGNYQGRLVHVVRVFEPAVKQRPKSGPIPIKKLWTFWHSGGYEIWIYEDTFMPAVVFYTNVADRIFANFSIDYDRQGFPYRLALNNNSAGFEGTGQIDMVFDEQGLIKGLRMQVDSNKGHALLFDGNLSFASEAGEPRALPPFGYKKVNRDHLKLLITTQVAGGLLQLKKNGVNIKNFKF